MLASAPDPVVTANLYGEGLQDVMAYQILAPLGREIGARGPDHLLWFVRYAKRGEHLKVRLHGPQSAAGELRRLLAAAAEGFFTALPAPPEGAPRKDGKDLPPIEREDEAGELQPDRSLLWTGYRRSFISLGGGPFLDDDRYVAHLTTCLGRGCGMVLQSLQPGADGRFRHGARQSALFKLVLGGLASPAFQSADRAVYLAYHRDWLVRFLVARGNEDSCKRDALLAQLDQQAEAMESILDTLREVARTQWSGEPPADDPEDPGTPWRRSLGSLAEYASRFQDDPEHRLDPFAEDVSFPALFKVLHGLANQLGLSVLNEALAYHLVLRAVAR